MNDELYKALMAKQKPEEGLPVEEGDQAKLEAYSKYLDMHDPKAESMKQLGQSFGDMRKAVQIAGRGPFQETSPEDQQFASQELGPMMEGLIGGGPAAGSLRVIGNPSQISKLTGQAVNAFPKVKSMFQAGEHVFPAGSAAEAMKIRDALEAAGKLNGPGASQILKLK